MPELPEVETIRRGIEPLVVGRAIHAARVYERRLRFPVPRDFEARVAGRTVRSIARRGKYLLLDLGADQLILHLGMSGRLFWLAPGTPRGKHDHLDLEFAGGSLLRLHDPRRFGLALLWPVARAPHPLLAHLGPEPFAPDFSADYLYRLSRGRSAPVKNFLMDGRVVVGAGNIYASEALFRAGIRPGRAAGRVTRTEFARLHSALLAVLNDAIGDGGTTLKDAAFVNAGGGLGYFGQKLAVYDRAGQPCLTCGTPIVRTMVGQRSSYYCRNCQR